MGVSTGLKPRRRLRQRNQEVIFSSFPIIPGNKNFSRKIVTKSRLAGLKIGGKKRCGTDFLRRVRLKIRNKAILIRIQKLSIRIGTVLIRIQNLPIRIESLPIRIENAPIRIENENLRILHARNRNRVAHKLFIDSTL